MREELQDGRYNILSNSFKGILASATKLRQVNVFTPACNSVHRGGVSVQGVSVQGGAGVSVWGGSLSSGVSVWVSLCLGLGGVFVQGGSLYRGSLSREVSVRETLPYGNVQAVFILRECILVFFLILEDISPFCGTTDTPVLDLW